MAQRSQSVRTPPFSAWPSLAPRLSIGGWERWRRAFAPFWIPGLALLCLLAGHALFRGPLMALSGKTYDYAQYLLAGTLFPQLLFGVPWLWRSRKLPWAALAPARLALAALALVWCALFLVASVDKHGAGLMALPPLLALAQTVLMQRPWRPIEQRPERLTAIAVVAVVAWTVAIAFLLEIFVQPPIFLAGFVAAFVLACSATWPAYRAARNDRVAVARDLIAVAVIAFMALRTDGLFEAPAGALLGQGALHHWAPWVGAADLMRQGGWLLWDVPSMYGFLSIVPLAILPTSTPWQALFLLQAASFFVAGVAIYAIVRSLRPGWLNWALALAMAVSVPMLFATFDAGAPVGSIADYPNHGPYRYLWCLILIVLLIGERRIMEGATRHRAIVIGGCLVWTVGVLWSPESAAYCSAVWLPAYAVVAFRAVARSQRLWRIAASWMALPVGILAASVGLITTIYLFGLGRPPDWLAYLDYVRGLGLEVLVVVNDPTGSALGLLLGFCLLATAAFSLGLRRGAPTRSLPLLLGLLGAFWATGLYGFTRAYATLHPIAYVTLAVMLVTIAHVGRDDAWKPLVRAATVPLLTLVLVSPLAAIAASPLAIGEAAAGVWRTARAGFAVEPLLPDADPALQALMAEAGVGPDDAIAFMGSRLGILLPPWRPGADPGAERFVATPDWLPGHPSVSLAYLPDDRGAAYLRRFIDRAQRGGWLVQHKTGDSAKPPNRHEVASGRQSWFFSVLAETHLPTRVFENEEWQLVWFAYVGRESDVARPSYLADRGLPPLLPDVTIDGQPLAEQDDPALWVLPGEGLGWYEPAAGGRWLGPRAEFWIYSQQAIAVSIGLRTLPGAPPVLIAIDDSAAAATHEAALQPGWNRVELCLASPLLAETASATGTRNACSGQGSAPPRPGFSPVGWFVTGIELQTSR